MPCFDQRLKIGKLQKKYTQNLTRCKSFNSKHDAFYFSNSKPDALYFLKIRIWRLILAIQCLNRNEILNSKSCFLGKLKKCKICRFHGVKRTKTWLFGMQTFFKIWHVEKFLIQNLTRYIFFQSKIRRVVKTSNQNLTRCENFNLKSDKFRNIFSKIWVFYLVFQVLTELWYVLSTFLLTYFKRGELKDNAC